MSIVVVYHFICDSIIIWTSALVIVFNVVVLWHHGRVNVVHHLGVVLALAHFLLLLGMFILVIATTEPFVTLHWIVVLILIVVLIEVLWLSVDNVWILLLSSELLVLDKLLSFCRLVLRDCVLIFVFSRLTSVT